MATIHTHLTDPPVGTLSITCLLSEWRNGNPSALEQLTPLVYQELRQLAHRYMKRENPGHLWQTTALVNEAWLKLAERSGSTYQDRLHFFAVAARIMRHLLVDFARQQSYQKRGGGAMDSTPDQLLPYTPQPSLEVLALHEALEQLAQFDARKSQIVELRYFGGLSSIETAQVLGLSEITIKREWLKAKAWLHQTLKGSLPNPE